MSLYKDWDQFEKPSKIKVYLNNGKTLEINPLKLKGGKRVYDAILQAFIDDRFDITDKLIQGMIQTMTESLKDLTDNKLAQHIINLNNQVQHYTQKKDEKGVKFTKQDLEDAKAELAHRKGKKEVTEARENNFVAKIDPTHRLATKNIETWDDQDMREYRELRDKYHGTDKIKDMLKRSIKLQNEAKGTLCGRCGHVHVKGTPCPRPFKEGKESTTFKVGDKVTYLGHPAEITKVNKEMTGAITYNVSYDKGTGKTKASNISTKDGDIKKGVKLTEAKSFTVDSESASDSDKITDFLTSNDIKFTKIGSKIKISLDRDTPKASIILSKLRSLSKFDELNEGGDKPDFLDLDKDGNKSEPMKKAAKDLKLKKEVVNNVLGKLKEVDVDPQAGSVVVSKTTSPADIKKYTMQGIDVQLKEVYDFFEKTMDDDTYVDVSGPSVEMTMEEILTDFAERIREIPEESREEALRAIKTFWINMIKDWRPNLTAPHRAPVTEVKHPILEVREYDYEGQMARTQLISIVKNAKSLFDSIGEKTQLQGWVQSKLTKAEDYLNAVRSYLEGESISNTAPLMVNNEPKRDAEGTALSIGDVVRGADGRIYQAVHSYSEGKPFLTPFDLKKRKTINLSERHYFDAVNENEMSPTKTMYKVMPHTQTKGGFTK